MSEVQAEYKTKAGRKSGYYWVKPMQSEWVIAEWDHIDKIWRFIGEVSNYNGPLNFEKINETRILNPDEQ